MFKNSYRKKCTKRYNTDLIRVNYYRFPFIMLYYILQYLNHCKDQSLVMVLSSYIVNQVPHCHALLHPAVPHPLQRSESGYGTVIYTRFPTIMLILQYLIHCKDQSLVMVLSVSY